MIPSYHASQYRSDPIQPELAINGSELVSGSTLSHAEMLTAPPLGLCLTVLQQGATMIGEITFERYGSVEHASAAVI